MPTALLGQVCTAWGLQYLGAGAQSIFCEPAKHLILYPAGATPSPLQASQFGINSLSRVHVFLRHTTSHHSS